MNGNQRREEILKILKDTKENPISATKIATKFKVSRQVIVNDIALIRAKGVEIIATPRGYLLAEDNLNFEGSITCRHSPEKTVNELTEIVNLGGTIVDVKVSHEIYGDISAPLSLNSLMDITQFMYDMEKESIKPLSELTDGTHTHTIFCENEEIFNKIKDRLRELNILIED